ncbi:MAG TPA: AMP-binding protein [Actinomycetota bacterium]|nr:AMP-binding protein [Actinomycetota bacterium]
MDKIPLHLSKLAEQAFERNGSYDAYYFEGEWLNTGVLDDKVKRLGRSLVDLGLGPGDRVLVMMANCPEVGMTYAATWRAGGAVTPAMFLLSPEDLRHIIEDCRPTTVVTTPEFASSLKQATEGLDFIRNFISTAPADGFTTFDDLMGAEPGGIVDRDPSDLACLLYTGGTTGRAKGVMLSHENMVMGAKAAYEAAGVIEGETSLYTLPLAHGYGIVSSVVAYFSTGSHAYLMRWFDPSTWLNMIQEHRIRRSQLVPTMIQMLLSLPLEEYDLGCLEIVNSGAAPLAPETLQEFERRVPSATVLEGYGATESGIVGSVNRKENRKIGTVGTPMPGYEIKAFNDDNNELPPGEPGEICIRSSAVMLGYWNSPEETADALKNGWLHTGDIGTVDEEGFIKIVDRKKDLIIRGGFNIFPRDIEDVLLEHPAVEVAGVVGKPDERLGEEVVAFVSIRPGQTATSEELIEHCRQKLGKHKYPREVRLAGYIPLTPVGKVDRKALRAQL